MTTIVANDYDYAWKLIKNVYSGLYKDIGPFIRKQMV